jgi:hypothetical protein
VFSCVLQFFPCDDGLIDDIRVEGPPELCAQMCKTEQNVDPRYFKICWLSLDLHLVNYLMMYLF